MKSAVAFLVVLAIVGLMAQSAEAYTVAGVGKRGFADFSKAIVFDTTSNPCPVNAETVATNSGGQACAIVMKPAGDGSWACTATIFSGATYKYYFEYRIPAYEDTTGWKKTVPGGPRNQDNNRTRTVTVPSAATAGYVFYNKFGDADVRGKQGTPVSGDSWMTQVNPDVATYNGTVDVSSSGDNDTTNMDGANNASVSVIQMQDTVVKITWTHSIGGDGFTPTLEGAREFDTTSPSTPYGFRILRARLASGWSTDTTNPSNLVFQDTIVEQVVGDSLWSPSKSALGISWYNDAISFTDTSLPANTATGDTYLYTVLWVDAYGDGNDTGNQNFSGGAKSWVRGGRTDVLFLVEAFDPHVVFPNGQTAGRVKITPYVDGIPQPAYGFWSNVYMARKS